MTLVVRWKHNGKYTKWHGMPHSTSQVTYCGLLIDSGDGTQQRSEVPPVTCNRCIAAAKRKQENQLGL